MATFSKNELKTFLDFTNQLGPRIEEKAKQTDVFKKIVKESTVLFEKNSSVLQTNIIGRQLLVNEKFENDILGFLGIKKKEALNIIKNSGYFKTFGTLKLASQLAFAAPLILLSGEYEKLKKYEEAQFIFFLLFFKPYASRISFYSKFLNEDQMRYTIEITLDNSYDIKKYGTLYDTLLKKSFSAFENYKPLLVKKLTDRDIHVIFTSGVYSRTNNFLKNIWSKYMANKGNYLPYERSSFASRDSDGGSEELARDIESDSAILNSLKIKITNLMNKNPIESKYLVIAAIKGFGKNTPYYTTMLSDIINEISDKMYQKFSDFYEYLFGSFLFNKNPETGMRYSAKDIKEHPIKFLDASLRLFKTHNTKDKNILNLKALLKEMLTKYSTNYINFKDIQKRNLERAIYTYLILMTRRV